MNYTVVFEVLPPPSFGLPDGSKVVLPAGKNVIEIAATFGPGGGVKTTPPKYRDERDAIEMTLDMGNVHGIVKDNVLSLSLGATNFREAYDLATKVAHVVARTLSLGRGELFSLKPVSISDGVRTGPPTFQLNVASVTYAPYDLAMVRGDLTAGVAVVKGGDPLMDKALVYYEHGLHLFETLVAAEEGVRGIQDHVDFLSTHHALALADCSLNWWKAVTTIMGDPSVMAEKQSYKSRYKQIGLSEEFFSTRIEPLRKLRNDADIAHYSLERKGLEKIHGLIRTAKESTEVVLRAYRDYLNRGLSFTDRVSGSV